jgi:hypothetical protein
VRGNDGVHGTRVMSRREVLRAGLATAAMLAVSTTASAQEEQIPDAQDVVPSETEAAPHHVALKTDGVELDQATTEELVDRVSEHFARLHNGATEPEDESSATGDDFVEIPEEAIHVSGTFPPDREGQVGELSTAAIAALTTTARQSLAEAQAAVPPAACICMRTGLPRMTPLKEPIFNPPPWRTDPSVLPLVFAWYPNGRDAIRIEVKSGSEGRITPLPLDAMVVQLRLRNPAGLGYSVATWAKEIQALNYCIGTTSSIRVDTWERPVSMHLRRADCTRDADTIVFRKPGFLGIWHDVGYFEPEAFWSAFGGQVVDFEWVGD